MNDIECNERRYSEEFKFENIISITYGKKELYSYELNNKEIETEQDIDLGI